MRLSADYGIRNFVSLHILKVWMSHNNWNRLFLIRKKTLTSVLGVCTSVKCYAFYEIAVWKVKRNCMKRQESWTVKHFLGHDLQSCVWAAEESSRHSSLSATVVFSGSQRERFCCQAAGLCLYLSKQNLISTRYRKKVYGQSDRAMSTFISSVT